MHTVKYTNLYYLSHLLFVRALEVAVALIVAKNYNDNFKDVPILTANKEDNNEFDSLYQDLYDSKDYYKCFTLKLKIKLDQSDKIRVFVTNINSEQTEVLVEDYILDSFFSKIMISFLCSGFSYDTNKPDENKIYDNILDGLKGLEKREVEIIINKNLD